MARWFMRWRLTCIGVPVIALAAYLGTERWTYTLTAAVLSTGVLALLDTFVQRELDDR
jgi:hypothetical protein